MGNPSTAVVISIENPLVLHNGFRVVFDAMISRPAKLTTDPYLPGQEILESGTYHVEHFQHLGPAEITLIRGQKFPVCEECGYGVMFYLRHHASAPDQHRIVLHRIPVLDDKQAA